MNQGFVPCKDDKPKYTEIILFQAGSDYSLSARIENAYLKELRRLRLEEEALLKKLQESSTVSEDSSN